jgi:hypothetical protein
LPNFGRGQKTADPSDDPAQRTSPLLGLNLGLDHGLAFRHILANGPFGFRLPDDIDEVPALAGRKR